MRNPEKIESHLEDAKGQKEEFKSLEQVGKELKEMGVEDKDIEIALKLITRIGVLDRKIFPDNPATFSYALKESPEEEFVGFEIPKDSEKERFYRIYLRNLARVFNNRKKEEHLPFFKLGEEKKQIELLRYKPEEFLLSAAAHEVRHRVQKDFSLELLSPDNARSIENQLLRSIIEYCELEFKELKKILTREKKSEEYINYRMRPAEFDAKVIEVLVANKTHEFIRDKSQEDHSALLGEIASAIKTGL
jgi:hypothetical protein